MTKSNIGKSYYRLRGNFIASSKGYLNHHAPTKRIAISTREEHGDYRTKFTEAEYLALAAEFQFPVDMFEQEEIGKK